MNEFAQIRELEELGLGKVVIFGATALDIDLLPAVYEALRDLGHQERLSLLIYCRGGNVNAARRIALLLHEFCDRLTFVVSHHCESAGTVMALAAHDIIAGPLSIFSPTDPHLVAASPREGEPPALSAQDIRLFWQMSHTWFGIEEQEARARSLPLLCESIFPTTLASFFRCTLELQDISNELLSLHMIDSTREERARIGETLIFDFHSHTYALTRDDMSRIGLPIERDQAVESVAWEATCSVRACIGAEARRSLDGPWHDAIIVTSKGGQRRLRTPTAAAGVWENFGP